MLEPATNSLPTGLSAQPPVLWKRSRARASVASACAGIRPQATCRPMSRALRPRNSRGIKRTGPSDHHRGRNAGRRLLHSVRRPRQFGPSMIRARLPPTTMTTARDSGSLHAPLLRVTGLTRRYGALTAVDGVSFEVDPGQIVAFLGPNGAGKTTTLRVCSGLLAPHAGEISVAGFSLGRDGRRARASLGFVPSSSISSAPSITSARPRPRRAPRAGSRGSSFRRWRTTWSKPTRRA